MKPEPLVEAVEAVTLLDAAQGPVVLLTPQGELLTQAKVRLLATEQRLTLVCGHYEGVDERVIARVVTDEISIGDYILSGGEPAAWVLLDAVARLVPGVVGSDASLVEESHGEGLLTVEPLPDGVVRSELVVTSRQSKSGEFFRHGAEWDPASHRTLRAWSDQLWRGEQKTKQAEIETPGVIDVVSGILEIRHDPPAAPRRLEIWSDGRLYPVLVVPHGAERREVAGTPVETRRYAVRGLAIPGRKLWKGELELWLAEDGRTTPVEILVSRRGARVRLLLDPGPPEPAVPKGETR